MSIEWLLLMMMMMPPLGNTLKYCKCCQAGMKYDGVFCFLDSTAPVWSLKKKARWKLEKRIESEVEAKRE